MSNETQQTSIELGDTVYMSVKKFLRASEPLEVGSKGRVITGGDNGTLAVDFEHLTFVAYVRPEYLTKENPIL